ncbi:multifunctional fatty acid oxidation complex subunit alpha [Angomonas deanei]|nr:multifunctional fatty acid oxidation complex subunit alpha [Angomonas deanei]|eukprot:EPY30095.1 multifunctional fatty acid oxidation complex subunit alpha [Angomonas deanei]
MRIVESTSIGRKKIADTAIQGLNKQTKGKYIAHYKALECILYSATHTNDQGYAKECEKFAELLCSPEAKNQMSLYFLDEGMKKSEQKTGIPKADLPPVRKVGVIGAGVMGSGIAHYFINKGITVAMKDLKEEVVKGGIERVRREFDTAVKRKRLTPADVGKKMALLSTGTTDEVLKGCDIIVEAAVEVMEIKKKLIQQLEADGIIHEKNIFATNTSSLSLSEMQTVSKYPKNIVGMHFFNPVSKMPLVEVIKGKETSKEAAALIFHLSLQTGKKPIIVNDGPGFLVNRILGVYMAEAGRLATVDKCDPVKVDEAILKFGMPMGPFRLLDEVGLDVACHVGPVLQNGLKNDRFKVGSEIEQMLKDGCLGKKNSKGFYHYDEKGKEKGFNTENLSKYFQKAESKVSAVDMVDRCVLLMVNEAAYILQEGIASTPEDVDIGMVFGTGFPPFRGGLLQYADHRGVDNIVKRLKELQAANGDHFQPCPLLEKMAAEKKRFFPNRPFVPYKERSGFPRVSY